MLLKAKVPHTIVQKILRHSDVRVTVGTYGHLDLDDMRMVMDDLATRTGVTACWMTSGDSASPEEPRHPLGAHAGGLGHLRGVGEPADLLHLAHRGRV